MKILITGGTGFIGSFLTQQLIAQHHNVTVIGFRSSIPEDIPERLHFITADTTKEGFWQQAVGSVDAVINLAGISIFHRWSREYKQQIYDTRIRTTQHVVAGMTEGQRLINASAVGYYGDRGADFLSENEPRGADFLSRVSADWEQAAFNAEKKNISVTTTRFGVVLGKNGGALKQMITPFKWFVGGPMGNGKQWFSWIHIADLISGILYILEHPQIHGPVNLCAPYPVTQAYLAKTLGSVLHRPSFIPAPSMAMRLLLGEFAETLLASQRAVPDILIRSKFVFTFPYLDNALTNLLQ